MILHYRHRAWPRATELRRQSHNVIELPKDLPVPRDVAEEAEALLTTIRRTAIADCEAQTVALEDACTAIIDNLHSNPQLA